MKKVLIGVVAASALVCGGSAWAADMPMYKAPAAPAAYDWTGLYFGGHIGGAWEKQTFDDPVGSTRSEDWSSARNSTSLGPA
jgi:opacity protein-like surface antigen